MVLEKIYNIISEQFAVPVSTLTLETNFRDDLNADSIDLVEFAMSLEEEFNLPEPEDGEELPDTETIGAVLEYINSIIG
jgi:acyl carrier protein